MTTPDTGGARNQRRPSKPDLNGLGLSHPARYSSALFPEFRKYLTGYERILDPFAGTGRIHDLGPPWIIVGVEIEIEWADLHERTVVGNALQLEFADNSFDAVCTSPTYGNRMADHYDAPDPEKRRSYKFDLGRDLHPENSGQMHWGREYRTFHERAYREITRVVRPGGRVVLNVKNHIRRFKEMPVTEWHCDCLLGLCLDLVAVEHVATPSHRVGANGAARIGYESVMVFDVPA